MGKRAEGADPLRVNASRVEKSCRVQRHTRSLPSWFDRVQAISFKENREVNGYDFDEDISELEDQGQARNDGDDIDEDNESERSYDGSDADYYYELKEERDERKREILQERKEKERERNFERTKEVEVRTAYKYLKKAEKEHRTIPIESLAGQEFNLFCGDHIDSFYYSDLYARKRVNFYRLDAEDSDTAHSRLDKQSPSGEVEMLYGDVYLDANANCNFGPFRPPKRASRKALKIKSCDGKYELSFKFIGNGYLKLRVSREMVFMNPYRASPPTPPPTAPETFEFVGIWRDHEKEKAERQKRMEARRSPSPRESWFEMNHPMGWYKAG